MRTIHSTASRLLLILTGLLVAGRVSAGPVLVTSGYVDLRLSSGPLLLAGDRGFTSDTRVGRSSGLFFALNCNDNPPLCLPGSTLNLGIYVDASDLGGNATLDGVTFEHVGGANSPTSSRLRPRDRWCCRPWRQRPWRPRRLP